ncbi:response regulator [Desulfosarcina cetonica]|uniref:response regulator n=1 Tax=Desulfosarcina cetonica TaxID=90730 RepID=UPI0006CF8B63|nr:response regulator [Desulfosarcina cetonica]
MTETNILIVEDERIIAEDLKDILLELGYGVCGSVSSGEAAVDLAEKTETDLVLMDIKLDGAMDGIDTADA